MSAESKRRWRAANRQRDLEYKRRYGALSRDSTRATRRVRQHGMFSIAGLRAEMWRAQDGRCYLCGDELAPADAVIDHDHRCCRYGLSCSLCRRGLACARCNALIGLARDSPEALHRIAINLAAALAAVDQRMAARPVPLTLFDDPDAALRLAGRSRVRCPSCAAALGCPSSRGGLPGTPRTDSRAATRRHYPTRG